MANERTCMLCEQEAATVLVMRESQEQEAPVFIRWDERWTPLDLCGTHWPAYVSGEETVRQEVGEKLGTPS